MEGMVNLYDEFRTLGWSAKETWHYLIEQSFETEEESED